MDNEIVKASINLHAVLRNFADLCELDAEAAAAIRGQKISICLRPRGLDSCTISFDEGKCTVERSSLAKSTLLLWFKSPQHFNQMIAGKAVPIPLKGFSKLGFLQKTFPFLAERLSFYLKPEADLLSRDEDFRRKSTIMLAKTAFFALAEIGNLDEKGRANATRIPEGDLLAEIKDCLYLRVSSQGGKLRVSNCDLASKLQQPPLAQMVFADVATACGILSGSLDSYACIGDGRLAVSGNIPMIDNLNKILAQVPFFVS